MDNDYYTKISDALSISDAPDVNQRCDSLSPKVTVYDGSLPATPKKYAREHSDSVLMQSNLLAHSTIHCDLTAKSNMVIAEDVSKVNKNLADAIPIMEQDEYSTAYKAQSQEEIETTQYDTNISNYLASANKARLITSITQQQQDVGSHIKTLENFTDRESIQLSAAGESDGDLVNVNDEIFYNSEISEDDVRYNNISLPSSEDILTTDDPDKSTKIAILGGIFGKKYELLNHFHAEEIYLDAGLHMGNNYSINADVIHTLKNSQILLDHVDVKAKRMLVAEGSWITFLDIKNNVKNIELDKRSRVSFVNHNKMIQIPTIMPKSRGFGDVIISGGTVNDIGTKDQLINSVIFVGGTNNIAGSIYANTVEIQAGTIEAVHDHIIIYSATPFTGNIPNNWYLSDINTLTPDTAVVPKVTVCADRTDITTASASLTSTNQEVATMVSDAPYTAPAVLAVDDIVSRATKSSEQSHTDSAEEHFAREVSIAIRRTLNFPLENSMECSNEAREVAYLVMSQPVTDQNSAKEYGNLLIQKGNLSQDEIQSFVYKACDDNEASKMNSVQKNAACAIAVAVDNYQEGIIVDKVPSVNSAALLSDVQDIAHNTILLMRLVGREPRPLLGNQFEEEGVSSGDNEERAYGLWIKEVYGKAKQGQTKTQGAYDSNTYGTVVGADMEFDGLMIVGIAYSLMKTGFKYTKKNKGDRLSADSHIVSFYVQNYLNDRISVKTIISRGISDIKNKRRVSPFLTATGKMSNQFYLVQSTADYKISWEKINVIPQLGLKYMGCRDSFYNEQGAGVFNANMKAKRYSELSAVGGMKVALIPRELGRGVVLNSSAYAYIERMLDKSQYTKQTKFAWMDEYFKNEIGKKNKQNCNIGANIGVLYDKIDLTAAYNLYLRKKYAAYQISLKLDLKL